MVWRLEIHNIGLNSSGDATLILAINDGVPGGPHPQAEQWRSVLIDGGRDVDHAMVDAYLAVHLEAFAHPPLLQRPLPLDVIVVTHYDIDHLRGITSLLDDPGGAAANRYANTIIFDQGLSVGSGDNPFILYVKAIRSRGARVRVTENVDGYARPGTAPQSADWLLNQEIMWRDQLGNVATPAALLAAPVGTNEPPPRITCRTANQYIQGVGPRRSGVLSGETAKNERSLGFLVEFNRFRFFIAGDLETTQEDAVAPTLNPTNDLAGRVTAIHVSHHGGNTSTSRAFLNCLKPAAAIISCGNNNQHYHPSWEVLNVLDGYPWAGGGPHQLEPPPSPIHGIRYYLTGFQNPNALITYGGSLAETAGEPRVMPGLVTTPGHIVLRVSAAQSNSDQRGEFYFAVREATRWAARGTGVVDGVAPGQATAIGDAAANAAAGPGINDRVTAVQLAVTAAANAAAAPAAVAAAAILTAVNEANGVNRANYHVGTIAWHTAQQTGLNGGTAVHAATAGAAAGAAFGGDEYSATWATLQALLGANVAQPVAMAHQANCSAAITAAVGVGLFDISYYHATQAAMINIIHYG
jgi:hypothetical protein